MQKEIYAEENKYKMVECVLASKEVFLMTNFSPAKEDVRDFQMPLIFYEVPMT